VGGQRQLHQDAVDARVGVQLIDQRQQLVLGRRFGQAMGVRSHAGANRRFALVAHIELAGGILADDDDRQARLDAVGGLETGGRRGDAVHQSGREGLAVDQGRARWLGRHDADSGLENEDGGDLQPSPFGVYDRRRNRRNS
jgi:hypothetical protein